MIYFNGFSLKGEEILFEEYLVESESTVAGFSFGAQQAFEYVYQSKERVDKLILLSPAFFQTQQTSFIRTQLRYFTSNKDIYVKQFLANVAYPSQQSLEAYLSVGSKEELEALLTYMWESNKIKEVLSRGTHIELFLGAEDKIIPIQDLLAFFSMTTNYLFKGVGHLLKEA